MSGQSASLSLEEARKIQKDIQHSQSHTHTHGGKKSSGGMSHTNICTKVEHQGK